MKIKKIIINLPFSEKSNLCDGLLVAGNNVDFSLVKFYGIHLRAISQ